MLHILFTYYEVRLCFTKTFFARDIVTDISRKIQIFAVRYSKRIQYNTVEANLKLILITGLLKKIIDFSYLRKRTLFFKLYFLPVP